LAPVRRSLTLVNAQGLHARPISKLIEVVRRHQAAVTFRCGSQTANGRRMLELLGLAAPAGSVLEVEADGPDADQLLDEIEALVRSRFGEE
jgi:phosphotransferase system HPr (HPr) family protein